MRRWLLCEVLPIALGAFLAATSGWVIDAAKADGLPDPSHAINGATDILLGMGFPGAVIIALVGAVAFLYWDSRTLRTQITNTAERRVVEVATLAKETSDGLAKSSATLASMTNEVDTLTGVVQTSLDFVRLLPGINERIIEKLKENSDQLRTNADKMDRVIERLNDRGGAMIMTKLMAMIGLAAPQMPNDYIVERAIRHAKAAGWQHSRLNENLQSASLDKIEQHVTDSRTHEISEGTKNLKETVKNMLGKLD